MLQYKKIAGAIAMLQVLNARSVRPAATRIIDELMQWIDGPLGKTSDCSLCIMQHQGKWWITSIFKQ